MTQDSPDQKPSRPPTPPPQRFNRSILGWVVVIAIILMVVTVLNRSFGDRREISVTEFWRYAENGDITGTLTVRDREIVGQLREGVAGLQADESRKFRLTYVYRDHEDFEQRLAGALKGSADIRYDPSSWLEGFVPQLLLMILLFGAIYFLVFRRIGSATGGGGFLGSFGRSRHRVLSKEHVKVTFENVAGIEEAKDEVCEIVEFLKNSRKFQRLGGRVPRGVLLVGEPGCGKTLLAKAIAGEAEVPFFSISGSDFVEMFVGVGASRVRDLFKQAKESSPCIIFLDEIDAVGRRRGMGFNGGGHDEREQTLNAILVEMDGFDSSDQVIVIAATNRQDVLDPALTRPGRFDRQIDVPLPDLKGRLEILRIYAGKVKCADDVELERLARGTPMFSGADLEALVNEAAISATLAGKDYIEMSDLEEARDKVRWGRSRKSRVIDEKEKRITAFHEAGHAVIQAMLPEADPLHKVSIIPRGQAMGATFSLPERDRYMFSRSYCLATLRVLLAGRLAEELFCGDVTSGAQNDIAKATEIARKMIREWGMSRELGMISFHSDQQRMVPGENPREYSEETAEVIDREIHAMVDEAYRDTRKLMDDHRDRFQRVAEALLKYETLTADEVQAIIDGKQLDKPTVGDLLLREQEKTGQAESDKPHAPRPAEPEPPLGPLPEPS